MASNRGRAKRPSYLRYGELAVPDVNGRYVRPDHRAKTLDELRERCGLLGPQAVVAAEYGAAVVWVAKGYPETQALTTSLGLPSDMTSPQRSRLASAAAEVVAAYRRAGSPNLLKHIHSTQHFVHSCAVNAALDEAQHEGEGQ